MEILKEILRDLFILAGILAGGWLGWAYLKAQSPEQIHQRRVEAKVSEILAEERLGADVRRRLLEAPAEQSSIREEV